MKPVLVLDTNALVTAALTPTGPSAQIVDLARTGAITLAVSAHLLDELQTTLEREKFRRWLTLEEVQEYVDALSLLGAWVDDRPDAEIPHVCDDPDDNFLVALYQDADAQMLVSGDKAVRRIQYPGVHTYKPGDVMEALSFTHEWGPDYLEGDEDSSFKQIADEGNAGIFAAYTSFVTVLGEPNAVELLPYVVVPETVWAFIQGLDEIRETIARRGMATRPIYASPEVAYIKLPPDPGVNMRAVGSVELPSDTIFATMQRCPELADLPGADFDHWRVFGIGASVEPERIKPRPTFGG